MASSNEGCVSPPAAEVVSPCTPPLQCSGQCHGNSSGNADQQQLTGTMVLDWSPQTPDSLPIHSVRDLQNLGVDTHTQHPNPAAEEQEDGGDAHDLASVPDPAIRDSPTPTDAAASVAKGLVSSLMKAVDAVAVEASSAPEEETEEKRKDEAQASVPLPSDDMIEHTEGGHSVTSSQARRPPDTNTTITTVTTALSSHQGIFLPNESDPAAVAAVFTSIVAFLHLPTLVELMRVCHRSHGLATSDAVWWPILMVMNLPPLLTAYERTCDFHEFFVQEVLTTRALQGHYTFQASTGTDDSRGSTSGTLLSGTTVTSSSSNSSTTGGGSASRDRMREDDSLRDDVFNIASLQVLISVASLGQANHRIGRVQLLLTYKNDSMEVLQGSCRFSVYRRCFSLCCSAFGTVKRGPVFTVAVATVTKPWANEGFAHYSEHKNGIRLVMTPVLWEGQSPGSQITEKDILVVSRPKPVVAVAVATAEQCSVLPSSAPLATMSQ